MDRSLMDALDARDWRSAVAWIEEEDDPGRVLAIYHGAVGHLYWASRDLDGVVALGKAGIGYGLRGAAQQTDEQRNRGLRLAAKAIVYDLGSYTWPGWDEPGIRITDEALEAGAEAAQLNLRLAVELERGDAALSRAQWLVGAHELAAWRLDAAREHLGAAEQAARDAEDRTLELLARGYVLIVATLDGQEADLNLVLHELAPLDAGPSCVEQLTTAMRVFARRSQS